MAIFSRRIVQQLINRLSPYIEGSALNEHIKILNKSSAEDKITQHIASEWELAVLASLSKLGKIKHQVSGKGPSKPDVLFNSQEYKIEFLADITVVSDINRHKDNPAEYFSQELVRFANKYSVPANKLTCHFRGKMKEGESRKLHTTAKDSKIHLLLPSKEQITNFIGENIVPFLKKVSIKPEQPNKIVIQNSEIDIEIKYDPQQQFFSGHYSSYTETHSLEKNPVYGALYKKSKQLKKSGYNGIKGVFLCDGGCEILKKRFVRNSGYDVSDIVQYFFEEDNTIDFVVVISIDDPPKPFFTYKQNKQYNVSLWVNGRILILKNKLEMFFRDKLQQNLPPIERTSENARYHLKSKKTNGDSSFIGGLVMNENSIKISSRGIQMLMAGEIDFEEFIQKHHGLGSGQESNFFKLMMQNGKTIESVYTEKCPDKDDDWIVFEFNSQDPSISEYKRL